MLSERSEKAGAANVVITDLDTEVIVGWSKTFPGFVFVPGGDGDRERMSWLVLREASLTDPCRCSALTCINTWHGAREISRGEIKMSSQNSSSGSECCWKARQEPSLWKISTVSAEVETLLFLKSRPVRPQCASTLETSTVCCTLTK